MKIRKLEREQAVWLGLLGLLAVLICLKPGTVLNTAASAHTDMQDAIELGFHELEQRHSGVPFISARASAGDLRQIFKRRSELDTAWRKELSEIQARFEAGLGQYQSSLSEIERELSQLNQATEWNPESSLALLDR